jgi:hypothetical protein
VWFTFRQIGRPYLVTPVPEVPSVSNIPPHAVVIVGHDTGMAAVSFLSAMLDQPFAFCRTLPKARVYVCVSVCTAVFSNMTVL